LRSAEENSVDYLIEAALPMTLEKGRLPDALMSPGVYIIAGPNGAGKTTFAREFLPNCRNFVNADLIAQGVSLFAPEAAAIRAGRLRLEEIDILAGHGLILGSRTSSRGAAICI
jgi:predicted AAA+ superfamily ATPase